MALINIHSVIGYRLLTILLVAISVAKAYPSNNGGVMKTDLKHHFTSSDDIPAGFFENETTTTKTNLFEQKKARTLTTPVSVNMRRQFPACRDGSGGLCVSSGECSLDKKPENQTLDACGSGEECCFGVPPSSTTCKDNGGECVIASRCGNGPQLKSATECNNSNGETCCIFV